VAPVVQPEAVAEAIFRAALDPKREYWVGLSTLKAILGNMVLPRFLDRYLARNVYGAQETRIPASPARRDNLMVPVTALHRTHGSFGAEAGSTAIVVAGPVARLSPLLASALVGLSLGLLLGAASRPRQGWQP
jgi:hypothetical protein